jgi:hypothetical protein
LAIDHIFIDSGLFDIRIYAPPGKVFDTKVLGIQIDLPDVEVIAFKDEEIITDVIQWRIYHR